jgi:hypothetical protein
MTTKRPVPLSTEDRSQLHAPEIKWAPIPHHHINIPIETTPTSQTIKQGSATTNALDTQIISTISEKNIRYSGEYYNESDYDDAEKNKEINSKNLNAYKPGLYALICRRWF